MSDKNTFFYPKLTLNCGGIPLDLSTPKVMGILNVTPDSFYDGGSYTDEKSLLLQAEKMLSEGADILDVGGVSTRPNAVEVSEGDELKRSIPAIESLVKAFGNEVLISIDTFRAKVAKEAVAVGARMVNDISAGSLDREMFSTLGQLNVPYVLMHMQGTPQNMQENPQYEDILQEMLNFFAQKVFELRQAGVKDIVLDPGFGFGKTVEHNYTLLKNLDYFKILELPLMVGLSRKSMINKVLKTKPENALNGTTALHSLALEKGARIIRAHDVNEAKEVIQLMEVYNKLD